MTHAGVEYLVALDTEAQLHEKLFRLDRLGEVEGQRETFTPPKHFDLERFRRTRIYQGGSEHVARLWVSSALADSVRDQFGSDVLRKNTDGSFEAELHTSSLHWLRGWVLSQGGGVEVLEPLSLRQDLAALCQTGEEHYQRESLPAV